MLKILRKKGVAKKILWVVAVVIIISFGFFGTAYLFTGRQGPSYAGKIFGKKVSLDDFAQVFRSTELFAKLEHGANYYNIREFLKLETKTWDRIILLHEANRRKISISDEEVVGAIEQYGIFQRNGQFDSLLYNTILTGNFLRVDPRFFEESIRNDLKLLKLSQLISSDILISEEDIFRAFKRQNEKVQVSYALIPSADFTSNIAYTEQELQQFYDSHQEVFFLPESINTDYIFLPFPAPDEEIAQESDEESVEEPEDDNEYLAVKEKAENIFQELLVNPKLKEIAGQFGVEAFSSGFFSREQPDLSLKWSFELLSKLFQLNVKEITDLIETDEGILIIQISEKRDAFIPPFQETKQKVTAVFLNNRARDIAREEAEKQLAVIKEKYNSSNLKDFPAIAKAMGLQVFQTPVFNRGLYLPNIGLSKDFQEAAFALEESNKISGVVGVTNGSCILHLDSYVSVDPGEYESQKEAFQKTVLTERKNEVFSNFLTRLRGEARLVDYISKPEESTTPQ